MDNCCSFGGFIREIFPNAQVRQDLYHLIHRITGALGTQQNGVEKLPLVDDVAELKTLRNEERKRQGQPPRMDAIRESTAKRTLGAAIWNAITGKSKSNQPQRVTGGEDAWRRLVHVVKEAIKIPSCLPLITDPFLRAVSNQQHHIMNCIADPSTFTVQDRFGCCNLLRSSSRVESIWRYLRTVLKPRIGPRLAFATLVVFFCEWNLDRIIQYDRSFPYVALHPVLLPQLQSIYNMEEKLRMGHMLPQLPRSDNEELRASIGFGLDVTKMNFAKLRGFGAEIFYPAGLTQFFQDLSREAVASSLNNVEAFRQVDALAEYAYTASQPAEPSRESSVPSSSGNPEEQKLRVGHFSPDKRKASNETADFTIKRPKCSPSRMTEQQYMKLNELNYPTAAFNAVEVWLSCCVLFLCESFSICALTRVSVAPFAKIHL